MAQLQVQRGVQNNAASSNPFTARGGSDGSQIVSEYRGRYAFTTLDGNMFSVASQAVATTTVGLATTYTGLCLVNPTTSTANLVVNKCTVMQSVIQATQVEAYALATGYNSTTAVTLTTPATPQSTRIGSGLVAQAKAATSATLPTAPLYTHFLTNTASATVNNPGNQFDLEGSIILIPGAYLCFVTPGQASVAGMWFSVQWEEVPITAG
jgi:hypothetical protein